MISETEGVIRCEKRLGGSPGACMVSREMFEFCRGSFEQF